ncbi:AI-2E family transporter [Beijerinckiaceae bacterium]|nr:AI-2E family transporter [Beijerinckiaceae bacterium]
MKAARPTVFWIGTLAVIATMVVLLRQILLPFVAGIALAYLLNPVVNRLEKWGLNRAVAALGILSVFIIGVGLLLVGAVPVIGEEVAIFIDKVPTYIGQLQALANDPSRPWLRKLVGEGVNEAQQSLGEIATLGADWIPSVLRSLWSDSQALLSLFSLLVVTPIVTFYLLNDWDGLIATIDRSIPAAQRETVWTVAREIDDTLAGFLRGQGTICLILAVYYAAALRLIGLNHGLLIGLAAGLISFIPYLGSLIGLVLSLCVAALQFWPDWTMFLVVLGIFVGGQSIADYALAPYLIASRINLNPVWVMFAIAAFGYLFGFVGLLIAVPLAAAIGVLVRFATREYLTTQLEPAAPSIPLTSVPQEPLPKKSGFWRFWGEGT